MHGPFFIYDICIIYKEKEGTEQMGFRFIIMGAGSIAEKFCNAVACWMDVK